MSYRERSNPNYMSKYDIIKVKNKHKTRETEVDSTNIGVDGKYNTFKALLVRVIPAYTC